MVKMNEMVNPTAAEDAAWAAINTPLSAEQLREFCLDVERLLRINPMLEFSAFKSLGDNRYSMAGRNISQEIPFEFDLSFAVKELPDGIQIDYDSGVKSSTRLTIEDALQGSKLTITDAYERLPAEDREQHLKEVDRSLVRWAEYLQRYLVSWQRWHRFGPWRWYMRRVWQPMKPMARRITYILLWISVVEVALIALGAAIWYVEYR
ncbi:MAG: hypothetical protein AMJ68_06800 [Acidithiobacillales bacterium SG8_45]|nr:MAG: hypothetical protein AMJ68_06800 [Acidithiobacillales bacterium SG8_45]